MGRKVYITSDMSSDTQLIEAAEENPEATLLWPWLLTAFDDWGRAEANVKSVKAKVFPLIACVTTEMISHALQLFCDKGLITLYDVRGKQYMAISPEKWFKHQTQIPKIKRRHDQSKFPAPPGGADLMRANERESAQSREIPRASAQPRETARDLSPSPSPTLTPTRDQKPGDMPDMPDVDTKGAVAPIDGEATSAPPKEQAPDKGSRSVSSEAKALAVALHATLENRGVTAFEPKWQVKSQSVAERLIRQLGDAPQVQSLIDWALSHPFWGTKIRNMAKIADLAPEWQQRPLTENGPPVRAAPVLASQFDRNTELLQKLMAQEAGGGSA